MEKSIFIVAEAGVNHNGDLALAKKLVEAAKKAGADAVKFQTFRADALASAQAPLADYQARRLKSPSQKEMIASLELGKAAHEELFAYCRGLGIQFLSTPFDEESADFLDKLGVERFKLSSGEVTNRGLLEHVARKGRPVILSTGMSDLEEVRRAAGWILAARPVELTLLHCVTEYPAPVAQVNLRAMDALRLALNLPVGYSDHTPGIEIAVAAAARGAVLIEKHLTLDCGLPGPDHAASLEPAEFAAMTAAIRNVEAALGDGVKAMAACEAKNRTAARRSLVALRDLKTGQALARGDLAAKRPGSGVPPFELEAVLGKPLRRPLRRDEVLTWEHL